MSFHMLLDYLAGLVAGDGNITYPRRVRVFDYSREFLENICQEVKAVCGSTCSIYWEGSVWCLSIYDRRLELELWKRLSYPRDQLEWVKGFVDAEGSIYLWVKKNNRYYYQVSVTNTRVQYIEMVAKELTRNGIKYRITVYKDVWKPRYKILVNRVDSVNRFLEIIGFRHPIKARKATEVLSHLPSM